MPPCRRSCSPPACGRRAGRPIHAIALRAQIRIEPQRRRYSPAEEERLLELFGETPQWGESLRPFLWSHVETMVAGFTGETTVSLPMVCSYDFEVAGAKYLHGLEAGPGQGEVPLAVPVQRHRVHQGRLGIRRRARSLASRVTFRLPVRTWRDTMDRYFPNAGWLRLSRDTIDHLQRFRADAGAAHLGAGHRGPPQRSGRGRRLMGAASSLDGRFAAARRSPTPCCTRATCSTRTGRRPGRTSCAGSSGCSVPPASTEGVDHAHAGRRGGRAADPAERAHPGPAGAGADGGGARRDGRLPAGRGARHRRADLDHLRGGGRARDRSPRRRSRGPGGRRPLRGRRLAGAGARKRSSTGPDGSVRDGPCASASPSPPASA